MSQKPPVIISVTGAYSGVGKTSLCLLLLTELGEFGAIKFTKTELYSSLSESISILDQKGKDTSSMIHAGARKVVWVKSPVDNLRSALGVALEMFSGVSGIIVEGNSPVDFLNPHLVIFIMGRDGVIKPSARDVIRQADIVVVNSTSRAGVKIPQNPLSEKTRGVFWLNPVDRSGEVDEFLSYVRRRILVT
jgi:molybdopterin-guanine dinucleotide biosynthesis protein